MEKISNYDFVFFGFVFARGGVPYFIFEKLAAMLMKQKFLM